MEGFSSDRETFHLKDSTTRAVHSSFALAELLSDQSSDCESRKLFLTHPSDARFDRERLQREAERHNVEPLILKPYDLLRSDRWLYLRSVMELVDESACVFDLSNMRGPMATTAICYASFRQLSDRSDLRTEVYLGRKKEEAPSIELMNLEHLLELPGWSASEDTLIKNGESAPLSSMLEQLHDDSYREQELPKSNRLQQLARMVKGAYDHLTSALPMEAGRYRMDQEQVFIDEVQRDVEQLNPALHRMIDEVQHVLGDLTPVSHPEDKADTALDEDELRRQIRATSILSQTGHVLQGFILARELLVNGAMLGTDDRIPGQIWLDGEERETAAAPFYLLNHWMQYDELRALLSDRQRRVARVWGSVKQRRNELAHAGFSSDAIRYRRLQEELKEKLENIRDLILNHRSFLSALLEFDFSGEAIIFPVSDGQPPSHRKLRFALNNVPSVTDVYLFISRQQLSDEALDACRTVVKETGGLPHVFRIPTGREGTEYVEDLWSERRLEFLKNSRLSAVMTGTSPVLDHLVRQIYQQVSRFGIHSRLIAVQEEIGSAREGQPSFEQVMIEQFEPSSRARSQ